MAKIKRNYEGSSQDEDEEGCSPKRFCGMGFGFNAGTESTHYASDLPTNTIEDNSQNDATYANVNPMAQTLMKSMGYEQGKGLGKYQQGIVDPVESSQQRGRRGLGFNVEGLEPKSDLKWDNTQEHVNVKEDISWIPPHPDTPPQWSVLQSWAELGSKKSSIEDESHFCEPDVLAEILQGKKIFDKLSPREMTQARTRSNAFETIGKMFFQNRAALKMANLDAVFDFIFTSPTNEDGTSAVLDDEPLYFADVCAAPGGFSEYVLWRRKDANKGFCDAKGFGFTLKENDFNLDDFFASSPEYFEPHYGRHGDGNIFNSDNIKSFRGFVLRQTNALGVHFMMADGGFSVEGQENKQELLYKQLYLCQSIVALGILREGGHFVCKLFDLFTPFSVGLIYLLNRCFKQVCIHKPNSSRPANSERYVICKWRRPDIEWVYEYLFLINTKLIEYSEGSQDILDLVPFEIMRNDSSFYDYIYNSNNDLGKRQVTALEKIRIFCQDPNLMEERQGDIKSESLNYWQIPDHCRIAPPSMSVDAKVMSLLHPGDPRSFIKNNDVLTTQNLKKLIHSPFDYRFVVLGSDNNEFSSERAFYLSQGGRKVFCWNGCKEIVWKRCDTKVELPADTLVFGEFVKELSDDLRTAVTALHLIDGVVLNGFPISKLHFQERNKHLKRFAMAVNKSSCPDIAPIRCKSLYKCENLKEVFGEKRLRTDGKRRLFIELSEIVGNSVQFNPKGILMLKITRDPWMLAFSKRSNRKYFFNTQTRESVFETPVETMASFTDSRAGSMYWWWDAGVEICQREPNTNSDKLHLRTMAAHFQSFLG